MVEGTHLITMSSPALIFYVQRSESTHDDVIKIRRTNIDANRYVVTYETEDEPQVGTRTMYMSENGVVEYVRNLVNALSIDASPFEYLQMTPPAFPAIQYRVNSLNDRGVIENIIATTQQTLENWPNPDNRVIVRRRRNSESPPATPVRHRAY